MDCAVILFFGAMGLTLLLGVVMIRGVFKSASRAKAFGPELQAFGARLSMTFSERSVEDDEPLVAGTLFPSASAQPNLRVTGHLDGVQVDVLGATWIRGYRYRTCKTRLAVVFTAPVARWPRFILRDDWAAQEPSDEDETVTDVKNVELPLGDEFEGEFTLAARSADEVRALFTPKLVAALLALAKAGVKKSFVVECFPTRMVLWRDDLADSSGNIDQFLAEARQMRALFDEAVTVAPKTVGVARCPRCGAGLEAAQRFCSACGGAVAIG